MEVVRAAWYPPEWSLLPTCPLDTHTQPANKCHKQHRHKHTHTNTLLLPLSLIITTYCGCNHSRRRHTDTDRHTLPYTPTAPQLPGERYTRTLEEGGLFPNYTSKEGVAVWVSVHVSVCVCVCVCVCLLKVLINALEIELMEGIIKGLSAGPIASHSLQAGQRICPPLQHLPKGLLLTPLPLYSLPLSPLLSVHPSLPRFLTSCALLTFTYPGNATWHVFFFFTPTVTVFKCCCHCISLSPEAVSCPLAT